MWATLASVNHIAQSLKVCLPFARKCKKTRLLSEGWAKDTNKHMNVTKVGGNNAGLNARAATFARINLVELIVRPHLDVFHQERLIFSNNDLHMKCIPLLNDFVCKLAALAATAQQANYIWLSRAPISLFASRSLIARPTRRGCIFS